jgi:hypothetical protein
LIAGNASDSAEFFTKVDAAFRCQRRAIRNTRDRCIGLRALLGRVTSRAAREVTMIAESRQKILASGARLLIPQSKCWSRRTRKNAGVWRWRCRANPRRLPAGPFRRALGRQCLSLNFRQ